MSHSCVDLEQGHQTQTQTHHRRSISGSDVSTDGSVCFSDADEGSCYSQFFSTTGDSYDEYSFGFVCDPEAGIIAANDDDEDSGRASSASDRSVTVETENGVSEIKVHLAKVERNCRICHLGLESNSHESGVPIELGCSCKDDLGSAHKNCAEAWFKIKGNKILIRTCEICQSIAHNVPGASEIELSERTNESNNTSTLAAVSTSMSFEPRSIWHGHRFLNFLLACMVFAFVVSWLFHFNMPSS